MKLGSVYKDGRSCIVDGDLMLTMVRRKSDGKEMAALGYKVAMTTKGDVAIIHFRPIAVIIGNEDSGDYEPIDGIGVRYDDPRFFHTATCSCPTCEDKKPYQGERTFE